MHRATRIVLILWLAVCAYSVLFLHLDTLPVQAWDEALFMLRAIHLAETGSMLESFDQFDHGWPQPNHKFSILTPVQALSVRLLGETALAIRLPIACLALATAGLLFWFGRRITGRFMGGWLPAMILLCTTAYTEVHMARTGDHDIGFAFFTTLGLMGLYLWLHDSLRRRRAAFLLMLVGGGGAMLTKSALAFLLAPGALLYLLALLPSSKLPVRSVLGGLGLILAVPIVLFGLREWSDPGFLLRMSSNAWSFFLEPVNADHDHGWTFYLDCLWKRPHNALPWLLVLPFTAALWSRLTRGVRSFIVLIVLTGAGYLIIASLAGTKTYWYLASIYPLLALVAGLTLDAAIEPLERSAAGLGLVLALLFLPAWSSVLSTTYMPTERHPDNHYADAMHHIMDHGPNPSSYAIYDAYMNPHITFYIRRFERLHGLDLDRIHRKEPRLHDGLMVLDCGHQLDEVVPDSLHLRTVHSRRACRLVEVINAPPASSPPCPPQPGSAP